VSVEFPSQPDVLVVGGLPGYARPGDAGCDLPSAEAVTLAPGQRAVVSTGVSIALPDGFGAFVMPRSGLAAKYGIGLVNSPGVVDAGYRGEIKVVLINTDAEETFKIEPGDRIAQLVIIPVARARFHPVDVLPGSDRGEGGFGSTGVSAKETTR
jgi:dUTP pyrophosphatase